jgi:hypothetical protein
MEPEGSLPYSQVPTTCPYPEPARSSPYPHIPLPEDLSYLANSLAAAESESALYRPLTFHVPNLMSLNRCLGRTKVSIQVRGSKCSWFATKPVFTVRFYQHFAQPPKLKDNPLSAIRDCLFNIFAATLHIGGRSSISNPRARLAVVTGTPPITVCPLPKPNN